MDFWRDDSVRPAEGVRPATRRPISRDFDVVDEEELELELEVLLWMEGSVSGRYHLSNFCSAI